MLIPGVLFLQDLDCYLINNLTTPKIKDLVKNPQNEYNNIYKQMNENKEKNKNNIEMKNELKNYLTELSEKKETELNTSHNIEPYKNTDYNIGTTLI